MPDAMDAVQADVDARVEDALRRLRASVRPQAPGLSHCETLDCREPIAEHRTRLGARLCEDCQREEDIRSRQYRGYR